MLNNRNIAISVLLIFKHYTQTKIFFFVKLHNNYTKICVFTEKLLQTAKLKIPFPIDFIYDWVFYITTKFLTLKDTVASNIISSPNLSTIYCAVALWIKKNFEINFIPFERQLPALTTHYDIIIHLWKTFQNIKQNKRKDICKFELTVVFIYLFRYN